MHDVIIIGAGAAGLFLAARLEGRNTLLLEKTGTPGNKLRITGGGMCNLTNTDKIASFLTHFGSRRQANFLTPALHNLPTEETRRWFSEAGLELTVREDGKVFPASLCSQDVIDTLTAGARRNGVDLHLEEPVLSVTRKDDYLEVTTARQRYRTAAVVLTSGGKSYPNTGSDGSGYDLAASLGHTIIPPTEALAGVRITGWNLAHLAGNSIRGACVDLFRKGESKRYRRSAGDLLFTHTGISGPVILNNARYIIPTDRIRTTLIPAAAPEEAAQLLDAQLRRQSKRRAATLLRELGMFSSLASALLRECGIPEETACADLTKFQRKAIISLASAYEFTVASKSPFTAAFATAGGVDLSQVDRRSMESKLVPGLYFAGEVLDIDGDTGGYNLQTAFSTAALAARQLERPS